ncbi:MAG: TRAP transporter large permease subunit [Planctomycetota bacterium]|jgi:TRAP-type C4-dicarboxylate transport system permease large subunit|nr:TRAP transporter large permease subunit [Planctomycetota bacterium]
MTLVTMGGMTPPMGVTMFAACSILKCPFEDYVRECMPFVVTIVLEGAILTFLPYAVMWLPNLGFDALPAPDGKDAPHLSGADAD